MKGQEVAKARAKRKRRPDRNLPPRSGERIDTAIVSLQRDAPVEHWRPARLASEIAEVYPSPYALPLDVCIAGAGAPERAMGFSPSLIEMPDGKRFTLNGPPIS